MSGPGVPPSSRAQFLTSAKILARAKALLSFDDKSDLAVKLVKTAKFVRYGKISKAAKHVRASKSAKEHKSVKPVRLARTSKALKKCRHRSCDVMGHSEYDTAWMARVPTRETRMSKSKKAAFPEFTKQVRISQAFDGGWAPEVNYMSARILATLASMLAVTEFDSENTDADRAQAEKGAKFVLENWSALKDEPDLTIGFEVVAASLIEECCERGFGLETLQAETSALRAEKLSKVPPQLMYSPNFNLGYTIEFMRDKVDAEKAENLLTASGSMSGSVGSTAYFARQTGNEAAYVFCEEMANKTWKPTLMPCNMPSRLWTTIWLFYHLDMAKLMFKPNEKEELEKSLESDPELKNDLEKITKIERELGKDLKEGLDFIEKNVRPHGLGWSHEVGYGDSDDTAVGFKLLADYGREVNWSPLLQYKIKGKKGFVGFLSERGPSVSANAHVLDAIIGREVIIGRAAIIGRKDVKDVKDDEAYKEGAAIVAEVADFLLERRIKGAYWTDKWHASPYYVTSHTLMPLMRLDSKKWNIKELVEPTIRWIEKGQREDGGWGWFKDSSAEETAYALYALALYYNTQELNPDEQSMAKKYLSGGLAFLEAYDGTPKEPSHPHLWIGKGLYRPLLVIRASVLTAQIVGETTLKKLRKHDTTKEPIQAPTQLTA